MSSATGRWRSPAGHSRVNCTRLFLGCLAALALGGCQKVFGPEKEKGPTTSITGHLRIAGRPVGRGWVEFMPIDGTIGVLRSAQVQDDGSFSATRVPVGRVAIRVVGLGTPRTVDPGLDRFLALVEQVFLIRRTIASDPGQKVDIDLATEALVFARTQAERQL
jgi:hypothetical protein